MKKQHFFYKIYKLIAKIFSKGSATKKCCYRQFFYKDLLKLTTDN